MLSDTGMNSFLAQVQYSWLVTWIGSKQLGHWHWKSLAWWGAAAFTLFIGLKSTRTQFLKILFLKILKNNHIDLEVCFHKRLFFIFIIQICFEQFKESTVIWINLIHLQLKATTLLLSYSCPEMSSLLPLPCRWCLPWLELGFRLFFCKSNANVWAPVYLHRLRLTMNMPDNWRARVTINQQTRAFKSLFSFCLLLQKAICLTAK